MPVELYARGRVCNPPDNVGGNAIIQGNMLTYRTENCAARTNTFLVMNYTKHSLQKHCSHKLSATSVHTQLRKHTLMFIVQSQNLYLRNNQKHHNVSMFCFLFITSQTIHLFIKTSIRIFIIFPSMSVWPFLDEIVLYKHYS